MKNEQFLRETFINNTIHLVTEGGFENATTRNIVGDRKEINDIKLNEGHIYRIFGTKEQLFAEAFYALDKEVIESINEGCAHIDDEMPFKEKCNTIFTYLWELLLRDKKKCRYYTRYYYSCYFKDEVRKQHSRMFDFFINDITPYFVINANVRALFNHVLSTLLNFAVCVYNGAIENNEDTRKHVFFVAYASIVPYIRSEAKGE